MSNTHTDPASAGAAAAARDNRLGPYANARAHAEEARQLAEDLERAIEEAAAGERSDSDLERLTTEIETHLHAIDQETRTSNHKHPEPPETADEQIRRTTDDLLEARDLYDAAAQAETQAREAQRDAARALNRAREIHTNAQHNTDAAHAHLEAARAAHQAARANQETAR